MELFADLTRFMQSAPNAAYNQPVIIDVWFCVVAFSILALAAIMEYAYYTFVK